MHLSTRAPANPIWRYTPNASLPGVPVRSLLAVLLTFAVAVDALAQNAAAARADRPEPTRVRVDLYAAQDGRPIDDLTRDEIELLEDGVPQAVDYDHPPECPD